MAKKRKERAPVSETIARAGQIREVKLALAEVSTKITAVDATVKELRTYNVPDSKIDSIRKEMLDSAWERRASMLDFLRREIRKGILMLNEQSVMDMADAFLTSGIFPEAESENDQASKNAESLDKNK